jgi:hypothetical protein
MSKSYQLCLPTLLLAASCVPPAIAVEGPRPAYVLAEGETRPIPLAAADYAEANAALPVIDPEALAPGSAAEPFILGAENEGDRYRSLQCLTTAIYHEARSETDEGQRAVAQVVLNRVRHPAFPNSVCGVVYQGSERSTGCQFSFTCDGSLARRVEPVAWARAQRIAGEALAGRVHAPVGLATHYHTTAIRPWWAPSLKRAVTIGSHIFYRWRGEWGDPLSFRQDYAGESVIDPTVQFSSIVPPPEPVEQRRPGEVLIHRGSPVSTATTPGEAPIVRVHRAAAASRPAEPVQIAEAAPVAASPAPAPAQPAEADHGVKIHR